MADALSQCPTNFCSAEAEQNTSRPYPASLSEEEDYLTHVFDPVERKVLGVVAALSDVALNVDQTPLTLSITTDKEFLCMLHDGYESDPWTKSLISAAHGIKYLRLINNLWFLDDRLVVPKTGNLRETLFRLAHDNLGHFGFKKSYGTLCHS
jgi:hypothetical protein